MKKYSLLLLCIVLLGYAKAQIPVSTFRDHLPYHNFKSIAVTPDVVYAVGESSILCLHKSDNSMTTWSKIEGLSEASISGIFYVKENNTLIVAYSNANLDFIRDDKLVNFSDIKNKSMVGSKQIYNFYVHEGLLYIACGFGVVVLNMENYLVKETWFTRAQNVTYEVKAITVSQNKFFIATDKGIFYISTSNPNIADFSEWTQLAAAGNHDYNVLTYFNGSLVANKVGATETTDSLFIYNHSEWRYISEMSYQYVRAVDVREAEILVCDKDRLRVYDTEFNLRYTVLGWYNQFFEDGQAACFDGTDDLWIGDRDNGLVKVNRRNGQKDFFTQEGPHSILAYQMDISDGTLALVPGSNVGYQASYVQGNFSLFQDENWELYRYFQYENLSQIILSDLCGVAVNPKNRDEVYAGSWGKGIVKYVIGENPVLYNAENSALQYSTVHPGKVLVSDVAFDGAGGLWMTNSFCAKPICLLQPNGTWYSFGLSPYLVGSNVVDKVYVDSQNYKWITVPQLNKLIVFYENNTLSNRTDDLIRSIDLNSYANVQTTTLTCLAEDLDGEMWIGTNQGIKVIYNPKTVFSSTVYAQNILMEVNGAAQNLLEFENITAIAVDAANRKWIGTSKAGAFLISENGTEELLHFTEKNSPLFSNQINDIVINHQNGEVYFATDRGIISYRGTASEAREEYDEVLVFPNPVREDYQGIIAVSGLMENSFCKIADAAGQLVWQGYAEGGQLNWDGKDFYGNKPATGVYFVFSSDETGKERNVAKILFIK